jgi:anti-sigma B factor antagonist
MQVERREREGIPILDVDGEVDLSTSPRLRVLVLAEIGPGRASLLLDLGGVTYMDSSGLATLVEALQLSRAHGGALALYGLSDQVRRIFELSQLHKVFRIAAGEDEAVRALGGGAP